MLSGKVSPLAVAGEAVGQSVVFCLQISATHNQLLQLNVAMSEQLNQATFA
jgi:hypothetical protein